MSRQFVQIKFHPNQDRSYTYHNDGLPVSVGDRVKVPARRGGFKAVEVVGVTDEPSAFATKQIIGKIEEEKPNE